MPKTQNKAVMIWLLVFAFTAAFLVVFGGFVRLTRSGLSIVEWNPVSGVALPMSEQSWQEEFAKYQQTPEFQKINYNMALDEYKEIFLIEWFHRLIARLAGLVFAIPFFVFLFKRSIPWKEAGLYIVMGILFLLQAFVGWYMVSSGLVDRPSVSQFRLTIHLLLALTLIGLALWTALGHRYGFSSSTKKIGWSSPSKLAVAALVVLLIQISYGGLTAGLKAGHVSDTWPLMFGRLIPNGLLGAVQPWALNLIAAPATVAFIHRWFAFVVLLMALAVYFAARRHDFPRDAQNSALALTLVTLTQIVFGISVVLLHVQIVVALFHQAIAMLLFAATIYLIHRLRAADQNAADR